MDSAVEFAVDDGVGLLTLSQPDRLNPMTEEMFTAIDRVVARLEPSGARALLITGAGRVFSAGGDINRMHAVLTNGQSDQEFRESELARLRRVGALLVRFARLPVARVAAINRCAVGAGLAFACACDYRIVGDDGFFDTSFARLGLPGDTGITYLLPRLIGEHRTKDWLMRPRRIYAAEALRIGLVDEVVPAAYLRERARAVALEFAATPMVTVRAISELVGECRGLEAALEAEWHATMTCKTSPEHRAAVAAFLEKR